jgi:hypothetical protein
VLVSHPNGGIDLKPLPGAGISMFMQILPKCHAPRPGRGNNSADDELAWQGLDDCNGIAGRNKP